jgi:hypothetical protein
VTKGVNSKIAAMALLLLLAGCREGSRRAPAIGEAFVGPVTLKIRSDIPLESTTAATVRHGDRLEILQRRRRFLRVRAPNGAEGWTDERLLLSAAEMSGLRDLAARAARLPLQGQATSLSDLNVHTQPDRGSPSFFQVKEKEKIDVLAHVTAPRIATPRQPLLPPPPPKKTKTVRKAPPKEVKYPPPPLPSPPPPPSNWLELSRTDRDPEDAADEPPPPEKPVPIDDWSLVRIPGGSAGWVLTQRLVMGIPDEVAQYAEGRRIVSYFSLGETQDEDQKKDTWLWTTIGTSGQSYDFDSFRVFVWSLRRHRYETAYIERNLKGYSPVLLRNVEVSTGQRTKGAPAAAGYPGFSLCVEKGDGQRYRREYAMLSNVVRFAGEHPCEAVQPVWEPKSRDAKPGSEAQPAAQPAGSAQASSGLIQRFQDGVKALRQRWFGR